MSSLTWRYGNGFLYEEEHGRPISGGAWQRWGQPQNVIFEKKIINGTVGRGPYTN
jgi:hypothetical protein